MHFGEYELFPSLIGLSPLPTAHLKTFQRLPVRSSIPCYRNFNLAMGRSQGFASTPTDYIALLRLAFASASSLKDLTLPMRSNSQDHYAKGTPSLRKASTACRHTVSGSFSLPYSGFFSPFPHGTSSLSVSEEYLALPDGSGGFRQDFTCPALLRVLLSCKFNLMYGTITLYSTPFQTFSTIEILKYCSPTTPYLPKQIRFGLFPLRSPLLRKSLLFSLPAPTQMFQFSAFAPDLVW